MIRRPSRRTLRPSLTTFCIACVCTVLSASAAEHTSADLEYFERKVRPLLAEHCYACHSAEQKIRGGLRLDVTSGWMDGGDSGPAIVPGQPDESPLVLAIRYDSGLNMPPDGRLPAESIQVIEEWIRRGAPAPSDTTDSGKPAEIDLEAGRAFWSYQPPVRRSPPAATETGWSDDTIDRWIDAKRQASGLLPQSHATREVLARRLSFDLWGLPPSPEMVDEFLQDNSETAYENLVDRLLASPHFGERWGRHWLDIVRFGESLTLRGFIFPNAWRYRDYVVDSFNADRPYDQFLREQLAGDLLPAASMEERQQQIVATTFLALGNTNLEEQEKQQLDMDVVDEQLDVIGKAFLGQTISCARCHDHKFDPIPTKDYYALAGILRSTQLLKHQNVSQWTEVPLPLSPEAERPFVAAELASAELMRKLNDLRKQLPSLERPDLISPRSLAGVVVDDREATKVGEWEESQFTKPFIGDGYLHDRAQGRGEKSLTFTPKLPGPGRYEVRMAYTPGSNRASNATVTIFSATGMETRTVNLREAPPLDRHFVSLGEHSFETANQSYAIVTNENADGHVVVDAMQFLPVDEANVLPAPAAASVDASVVTATKAELKRLEGELAVHKASAASRPMVMTVIERKEIADCAIHIRGTVHNLGEIAPRGFLRVAVIGPAPEIPSGESGRRQLADWIASPQNPLTARVFVNRVWCWLMGEGLVRSVDNFGTTGESPSHPELLDQLAIDFVEQGWSVKQLVRAIVLSRTYQQASSESATGLAVDPENRLLWRAHRRRLDADAIRDALLRASGRLNDEMGGSTIPNGINSDFDFVDRSCRRSLYVPAFRNAIPPVFEVFDAPDPSMVVGRRNVSTIAPQALFFLNDPFVIEQAQAAAERLLENPGENDDVRIEQAFRQILGRKPSERELLLARGALEASDAPVAQRWAMLIQSLFASLDFRYCD